MKETGEEKKKRVGCRPLIFSKWIQKKKESVHSLKSDKLKSRLDLNQLSENSLLAFNEYCALTSSVT